MKYESVTEAAQRLGINRSTLQRYCREHRVPGLIVIGGRWYAIPITIKATDINKPVRGRPKNERQNT